MDEVKELKNDSLPAGKFFSEIGAEGIDDRHQFILSNATPEDIAISWSTGFTNPIFHNKTSFRYLVYGSLGEIAETYQALEAIKLLKQGKGDISQMIDLLEQPRRIADRRLISASVIDQNHTATFGEGGLILKAPFENILDAAPRDLGTDFVDPESTISNSAKHLCTVDELIETSSKFEWNEVRIIGKTDAGEVKVSGFWIKIDENGKPFNPELTERLHKIASLHGLPFVEIIENKKLKFDDSPPEVHTDIRFTKEKESEKINYIPYAISINRKGQRYFIDFNAGTFDIINEKGKSRQMTDDEFTFAKKIIETELDPDQKQKLQATIANLQEQFKSKKDKTFLRG